MERIRILIALIALFFSVTFASAQQTTAVGAVPNLINYSGVLKDGSGKVLTSITGVTFLIYSEPQGGAPVWMETQNVQPDARGNYTAQLGSTKPEGMPVDLFTTGEARWLALTVNGGEEQPRVLLVAVPYAMKAADAQTLGGLPASAFVLAAPPASAEATSTAGTTPDAAPSQRISSTSSNVTTTGGTVNTIPLFSTSTNIQNSILTQSGTTSMSVAGALNLPATGTATKTAGKNSQPETMVASSFSSSTSKAVNQTFQLQAEPASNNTSTPSGTLNLLYGSGTTTPSETGLKISSKGILTFASGQTFPGTGSGTITGVTAGTDLTGGGTSGKVTLNLDTTKVPQLNSANTFNGNQGVLGTLTATGSLGVGTTTPANVLDVFSATDPGGVIARFGSNGTTDSDSTKIYNGSAVTETFLAGCAGCFVPGAQVGDGGVRVLPGKNLVFGDSGASRLILDSSGNASQPRTAGGMVKAMLYVNASNPPYQILRCYNSALTGAAATTPPCGINFTEAQLGVWDFDFGYEVDDRFLSATLQPDVVTFGDQTAECIFAFPKFGGPVTTAEVWTTGCGTANYLLGTFYLLVY